MKWKNKISNWLVWKVITATEFLPCTGGEMDRFHGRTGAQPGPWWHCPMFIRKGDADTCCCLPVCEAVLAPLHRGVLCRVSLPQACPCACRLLAAGPGRCRWLCPGDTTAADGEIRCHKRQSTQTTAQPTTCRMHRHSTAIIAVLLQGGSSC